MSISVPHQFVDAAPVQSASSSYMNTMKRGFEMAGERIDTVVEIKDLRNKRRADGYLAEDGTTKLRGSAKPEDKNDLYGEEWLAEFVKRHEQLDANPHMNFVRILTGMSNSARQTFIDESLVNRATAARIEAAQRLLNEIRTRQNERDTTGSSIAEQASLLAAANEALRTLELQRDALVFSRKEFLDLVVAQSTADLAVQVLDPPNQLFPQLVYRLVALGWPNWLKDAPERLIQVITAAINKVRVAVPISDAMPLIGRVVFFIKTLEASADKVSIKTTMLEKKLVDFRPGSEYSADPYLYYRDLSLLSPLFARGSDSITLFSEISLVLYAHLNKMRRRAGLDEDLDLERPVRKKVPGAARGQQRTKRIDGDEGVFDLGDDALEYMADDEIGLYTKEQIEAARSTKATNTDPKRTLVLIEALLQPFVFAFLPLAFFTSPEDALVRDAGIPSSGSPVTTIDGAEAVFTVDWILRKAFAEFAVQNADVGQLFTDATVEALGITESQLKQYTSRAIKTLTVETKILAAFAACAIAFADAEAPLPGITPLKLGVLRKFLADPTESAQAYDVLTRSLLTRSRVEDGYAAILTTPSAKTFYDLIGNATDGPIQSRIDAAKGRVEQQVKLYETLLNQRSERIEAGKKEVIATLQQALTTNYIPTAGVALSPMNSGLIFYTDVTVSAMSAAHDMLVQYVPCLVRQYATSDALIVSDEYCQGFAGLVNSQVRLADVRNPTSYRQTVHETRARQQAVSALNHIRMICGQDRSIRHVKGCTCLFRS